MKNEFYFGLDEIGRDIWQALIDQPSIRAAIEHLLSIYDVTQAQLEQDVLKLVAELIEHELVEIDPA